MATDMQSDSTITRRTALAAGAAAMGLTQTSLAAKSDNNDTPWIDAHSHIWSPEVDRFPLQPGMTVENLSPRSFNAEELMEVATPEGVGRVVLIQHPPFHGFDNSYLIDAWRRYPEKFRVVGGVDDLRPYCGKAMKQLLQQGVTGFRIGPREGITDWLNTAGMKEMWQTAAETRQPMCCLIDAAHLPLIDAACQRHPETPVVIDHFARIGIDGEFRENEVADLCRLAIHPHVKVKISAYYALGNKQPPHTEIVPLIRRLLETFGANRLMWASDSPYQLARGNSYASSISLIRDRIDFVSETERRQLLQTTAEDTFFFV
jgi:predicted TIM-barrel fold metal-dependent hydrolase